MILRFQSRNGQFRLTVQPSDTFTSVISQVAEKLPESTDRASITVSNRPHGGDARPLAGLGEITFGQVGLKYA